MTDVQPSPNASTADVERFLTGVHAQINTSPEEISAAIVADILKSASVEEVFAQQETTHAEDVLGERLLMQDVKWLGSDVDNGPGFYALIRAVDDDGVIQLVTCGARNVMAQLFRLQELNALPIYAAIVENDRKTASGYNVMRLEPRTAPA